MLADAKSAPLRAPLIVAALLAACATPPETPASAPLTVDDAPQAPSLAAPQAREVLDRRGDGALITGLLEPAPADSDPERVLVLSAEPALRAIDPALEGARVLDARFVGDDTIVTVGADHVLRAHAGGGSRELDAEVEAPLSVAGTTLAYARGDMPFFELARADVATGEVRAWTEGMAPVWSPALSPDGREAIFVSGAAGAPRLHRIAADGAPIALPALDRFPSSPRAPRWQDGTLTFEDETGATALLDVATGRLVQ